MEWPITETPTWAERQTYGPVVPDLDFAEMIYDVSSEPLAWRHIHFMATMKRENGLMAWARPLVWKPGDVAHLSTDRGVCALNSHWWKHVPDVLAYEPAAAVGQAIVFCETEAEKGTQGASMWDWGPILDWQWHGYLPTTPEYKTALHEARFAINAVRAQHGSTGI